MNRWAAAAILMCGVLAIGCADESAKSPAVAAVSGGPKLVAANDAAPSPSKETTSGPVHEQLPTDKIVKAAEPAPTEEVLLGTADLTHGIPGKGPLKNDELKKWLADPKNSKPLKPTLPMGLSVGSGQIAGLEKNPLTRAKIELGRQL